MRFSTRIGIFSISWGEPSEGLGNGQALGSNLPKVTHFIEMLLHGFLASPRP